eukprot:s390_g6.t1
MLRPNGPEGPSAPAAAAEEARTDALAEPVEAVLSGSVGQEQLRVLGERLAPAAAPRLLAAVAGLRLSIGVDATPSDMIAAVEAAVRDSARAVPPKGTLAALPPLCARQVLTRISLLFAALVSHLVTNEGEQHLTTEAPTGLLTLLGTLRRLSGTSLRSLRQAATAGSLGALAALAPELRVAQETKRELELQLEQIKEDAGSGPAAAARAARLLRVLEAARRREAALGKEVQELDETVLFLRLRDAASSIRRLALQGVATRLRHEESTSFRRRVLAALSDPSAEVRSKAVEIVTAWFAEASAHKEDASSESSRKALAKEVANLLAERAEDVDPRVAASVVHALRQEALASQLSDDAFSVVARLCLIAPDSHFTCRVESALFVDEHLLPEPGLGTATKPPPSEHEEDEAAQASKDPVERHFEAEHGLISLAEFLSSYLGDGQLHLGRRFVQALWRRAAPLQCWAALADLCLVGEGDGAARPRQTLLVVLDGALACASAEDSKLRCMDAAAGILAPRLPRLFAVLGAEEESFCILARLTARIVRHVCEQPDVEDGQEGSSALPRPLLPALLRLGAAPQRAAPDLAEALASWALRSLEVQAAVRKLTTEVCIALEALIAPRVNEPGPVDGASLQAAVCPLLALGKKGIDLWTSCEKPGSVHGILRAAVTLIEGRNASGEGLQALGARAAAALLELLVLLCAWRARQIVQVKDDGTGTSGNERGQGISGFLLCCHCVRSACATLLAAETNLLLRFQGFSSYLTVLQMEFTGFDNDKENEAPTVPAEHIAALDATLAEFYAASALANPCTSLSASGWRSMAAGKPSGAQTSCRCLVDAYLHEDGDKDELPREAVGMAATAASRMVAECEHEAIFSGPLAGRVLRKLSTFVPRAEGQQIAESFGVESQLHAAALQVASKLRRLGGRSANAATRGYLAQFRAVSQHATETSLSSGLRLASMLLLSAGPPIIPGSRAAVRLGKGLAQAVRQFGMEAAAAAKSHQRSDLEILVPWLRDPSCPLPGSAARELANALAAECGLLHAAGAAQTKQRPGTGRLCAEGFRKVQEPAVSGAWAVVHALQALGKSALQRSPSWKAATQVKARRRLRRQRSAPESRPPATAEPASEGGWLPALRGGNTTSPPPAEPRSRPPKRPATPAMAPPCEPSPKRRWKMRQD